MWYLVFFKTKLTDTVMREKVDKFNVIRFKYRKILTQLGNEISYLQLTRCRYKNVHFFFVSILSLYDFYHPP